HLMSLNLSHNRCLARDPIQTLASSPHLVHLNTLDLGFSDLDAADMATLTSWNLSKLCSLQLRFNNIGDAGAVALSRAPFLSRLRDLFMRNTEIGDNGGQALASALNPTTLRELDLRGNNLSNSAKESLRKRLGDRVRF